MGGQAPQVQTALSDWRAGAKGCRMGILTAHGFVEAMESLGLIEVGDGSIDDQVKERMKAILAANQIHLFRNLSVDTINSLVQSLSLKKYSKEAVICVQGEVGHTAFIVASGELSILVNGVAVRTVGHGTLVGERALLFSEARSASIEVVSQSAELWCIDQDVFTNLVSPSMRQELLHRIELRDSNFELNNLRHMRFIGKGAFGSVRLVLHEDTGTDTL